MIDVLEPIWLIAYIIQITRQRDSAREECTTLQREVNTRCEELDALKTQHEQNKTSVDAELQQVVSATCFEAENIVSFIALLSSSLSTIVALSGS